ncbi:MAG: class I SAM-dependent methyltransferase [Betaproteobacteria bacterium]|nr:class I SAM-dependent methyltransferase [Betaproteobacteria bacterium]
MDDRTKPASLHDWFSTPLGTYVLGREQAWLDETTPNIFGYHALQLGLPEVDLLRESRIVHRLRVSPAVERKPAGGLCARLAELPIATQSVDLAILPHVLEFAADPHDILREIDRIMIPEGRLIIIGFNPWSLFGMRRLLGQSDALPWNGRFVSLLRMKDWLSLLGFDVADGHLACYAPPMRSETWLRRWGFLDATGGRWWGVAGGVYMLEAVKRVRGTRIITPAWSQRKVERKFAAAAKRQEAARTSSHLTLIK